LHVVASTADFVADLLESEELQEAVELAVMTTVEAVL